MRSVKIEIDCINLNLLLAGKHLENNNMELAAHRVQDARKSLEELEKQIKKAD